MLPLSFKSNRKSPPSRFPTLDEHSSLPGRPISSDPTMHGAITTLSSADPCSAVISMVCPALTTLCFQPLKRVAPTIPILVGDGYLRLRSINTAPHWHGGLESMRQKSTPSFRS